MLKRTALTGLGLVLLASPLLVSAQSISDLQAQVNALLAQLQALQQQQNQNQTLSPLPSPSPVPPYQPGDYDPEQNSACVALQYNLKYRMTDARTEGEVSLLQDFLQAEGYLNSTPTGFFGLQTLAAAKKYQRSVGLANTGYVGPLTRAKIKEATCSSAAPIASSPTINPITPTTPSPSIPSPVIAPVAPTTPSPSIPNPIITPVAPASPTLPIPIETPTPTPDPAPNPSPVSTPALVAPAGYPWSNFYGKGMTYTVETAAEIQDAADSGFRIIMLDIYRNIPADIHNVIKRNGLKFIVRDLQYRALECQPGACDREKIMAEARADIASMTDPDMIGFYILDDPTFDGEAIAKDIHAVVAESNQTSSTKRPTICGIAGYLNWYGQSVASTTEYRIVTDRAIRNFSPQGCDIVAPYAYAETYVHVSDPSQVDWKMTSLLPYIKTGLAAKGWNINSIPMIGIPQAFFLTAPGVVKPRPEDLTDQAEAYCKAGATALMPFTWDYNGGILTTGQPPYLLMFNTPWLKQSMINGLARCASYWAQPGTSVTPPELLIRAFDPWTQAWVDGSPAVQDNSLVPLTTIPTISIPYNAEPYFQWGANRIQPGSCRLARTPGADNAFSIYALGAKGGNTIYYGDFQNTSKGGGNITIPHTYAFSCSDPTGATLWSTSIIVNVTASQSPIPTATLTINGKESDTVSVGSPFKYVWSSTNADHYTSSFTSTACGSGDPWVATNASGVHEGIIDQAAAGCTYTVNYKATQSATGKEATKTIEVIVRALAATPIRAFSATASNSWDNYVPANTIDADESTGWISGGSAEQWIEFDFGAQKTLSNMSLVVEQSPSGNTVHEIYAGTTPNPTTLVRTLSGFTQSADVLKVTFSPALTNIRYVRVKTVASPSWVAWQTIKFNDEPTGMSRKTGQLANVIGALSESFSTRPASAVSDPDLGFSYHFTL
ncbi:MAG: RHS-related protein, partial [Parcubacteria group bacterium GW2011_GWA2_51_10]